MPSLDDLIRAIDARSAVELVYRRDGEGRVRVCRPHVVFEDAQGRILVEVFQTGGHSSQGNLPGWRHLHVDQISEVRVVDEPFDEPAEGYNPANTSRYRKIISRWPA